MLSVCCLEMQHLNHESYLWPNSVEPLCLVGGQNVRMCCSEDLVSKGNRVKHSLSGSCVAWQRNVVSLQGFVTSCTGFKCLSNLLKRCIDVGQPQKQGNLTFQTFYIYIFNHRIHKTWYKYVALSLVRHCPWHSQHYDSKMLSSASTSAPFHTANTHRVNIKSSSECLMDFNEIAGLPSAWLEPWTKQFRT